MGFFKAQNRPDNLQYYEIGLTADSETSPYQPLSSPELL